jgi:hypothetical protein
MRNWLSLVKRNAAKLKPAPGSESRTGSCSCKNCASNSLKRTLATYPVHLTDRLAGKRIDVYRVELDQCRDCGHLMPTPKGQAKVKRCVKKGRKFFLNNLH